MYLRIALFFVGILASFSAFAICPICTIAVGAGIGLTEYLGIDDTIAGLWIGGLNVSLIVWTVGWLNKKNIKFFGRKPLIAIFYYALTILPLYFKGMLGNDLNKIWGYDKIIFGVVVGSIAFAIGALSYAYLKKRNGDKAYFPFQKVVMPVLPLIILSIIFYFITK